MKYRFLRIATTLPVAAAMAIASSANAVTPVAVHALDATTINQRFHGHLSGFLSYELDPANAENQHQPASYFPRGSDACPVNQSSNIKVNQNCLNISDPSLLGRGQSQNETAALQDPSNPNHMIATFNDYRRGDGNCYGAYSTDKGRTWNDTTIPMSFTRGAAFGNLREYWQAGGDTSIGWDTKGNAYFSCQVFARGKPPTTNVDFSSAFLVFRSTLNNGASWNFPGRYVTVTADVTGSQGALEDKQYLTVDNHVGSPFQDRIYVTWTHYDFVANTAVIMESYSNDYGEHFSAPHPVGFTGGTQLCPYPIGVSAAEGSCDNNQFSQPFTAPDGTLYVIWANYNSVFFPPSGGPGASAKYQILISKSTDGGNTFTPPQKVSDFYELPDCAAAQAGNDAGRACVPEKGPTTDSIFRAANYPVGGVNPANPSQVVVSVGSYVNAHDAATCKNTGSDPISSGGFYNNAKTAGCNNTIVLSVSNNAGATFTGTTQPVESEEVVTQDAGQATTDQWWQWLAFNRHGKLAISYYDRQYGTDEVSGYSDFSLSGSGDLTNFAVLRVSSGSMPPPNQFGGAFWGDYTGLSADDTNAYPIWSDTRDPLLLLCPGTATPTTPPALCGAKTSDGTVLNDQDIFTAALPIPSK